MIARKFVQIAVENPINTGKCAQMELISGAIVPVDVSLCHSLNARP